MTFILAENKDQNLLTNNIEWLIALCFNDINLTWDFFFVLQANLKHLKKWIENLWKLVSTPKTII